MPNQKRIASDTFSEWVRRKDADYRGMVKCYTCETVHHWKFMQASHFAGRSNASTFVDEINVQVGCFTCNVELRGNLAVFAANLDRDYGEGTAEMLKRKARQAVKFSDQDWRDITNRYRVKLMRLNSTG